MPVTFTDRVRRLLIYCSLIGMGLLAGHFNFGLLEQLGQVVVSLGALAIPFAVNQAIDTGLMVRTKRGFNRVRGFELHFLSVKVGTWLGAGGSLVGLLQAFRQAASFATEGGDIPMLAKLAPGLILMVTSSLAGLGSNAISEVLWTLVVGNPDDGVEDVIGAEVVGGVKKTIGTLVDLLKELVAVRGEIQSIRIELEQLRHELGDSLTQANRYLATIVNANGPHATLAIGENNNEESFTGALPTVAGRGGCIYPSMGSGDPYRRSLHHQHGFSGTPPPGASTARSSFTEGRHSDAGGGNGKTTATITPKKTLEASEEAATDSACDSGRGAGE